MPIKNKQLIFLLILSLFSYDAYYMFDTGMGSINTYTFFFVFFIISFFVLISKSKQLPIKYSTIDYIPLIFLMVWGYGVFVGISNNIDNTLVFRNFIGMILYVVYYFFIYLRISKSELSNIFLFFAHLSLIVILINAFPRIIFSDIGTTRYFFSQLGYYSFSLIPVYLYSIKENQSVTIFGSIKINSTINKISIILLAVLSSVVLAVSDGFTIALFMILLLFMFYFSNTRYKIVNSLILLSTITVLYLFPSILSYFTIKLLDSSDVSNDSRMLQIKYLWEDSTFFGRGLGAGLSNGFYRDSELKYAYEATYNNVIHKFGFASVFLLSSYIYIFIIAIKRIKNRIEPEFAILSIGLMTCFLAVGFGNPVIFSPTAVLLHCSAIYLIRQ